MRRVVVGIDGRARSGPAMARAAEEARRLTASLDVVSVWSYPPLSSEEQLLTTPHMVEADLRDRVDRQVEEALGPLAPCDLQVHVRIERGPPGKCLLAAAEGADLLVVGRRDRSHVRHLLLGSVADQCIRYAPCPTMVVPAPDDQLGDPTGPIVVGVDSSPDAQRALRWAVDAAGRSGCTVAAIHCWDDPMAGTGELSDPPPDLDLLEELARRRLTAWVFDAAIPDGRHLHPLVRRGDPAIILVHEASAARLLVVGSRGRGGFSRLLLGSVAHHAAHLAASPVVVLPHHRS